MNIDNNQLLSLDELRDLWNAQADAANSWDALGADEIAWWAQRQALARAGLADGPAVPEGREPASVVSEPSDEELLATLDKATATFPPRHPEAKALNAVEYPLALELRKARAVLARWGRPAPVPAEGEVAVLLRELRDAAFDLDGSDPEKSMLTRAADLLEQRHPVPVPVSERLPGAEDCKFNPGATVGVCWCWNPPTCLSGIGWWSFELLEYAESATHWLPAHALPLPTDAGQSPA